MMVKKPARLWVDLTCADWSVAFRGEWPGPEGPDEIVALAREQALSLGVPVQVEIRRHGVWSIDPKGRVAPGRLFRPEKLAIAAKAKKRKSRTASERG
jgi:hypothetical protein